MWNGTTVVFLKPRFEISRASHIKMTVPLFALQNVNVMKAHLACRVEARSIISGLPARLRCASARQSSLSAVLRAKTGGEGGIRTLDTLLRCLRFPGVCLKPLGHLSVALLRLIDWAEKTSQNTARNNSLWVKLGMADLVWNSTAEGILLSLPLLIGRYIGQVLRIWTRLMRLIKECV